MSKRYVTAALGLMIGIALMLAPLSAPSGMGVAFLYYIACGAGVWLFLVSVSLIPQKGGLKRAAIVCRRSLFLLTAVFILLFGVAELYILTGSTPPTAGSYDAVVILGAGLHGERPSSILYSRLSAAQRALLSEPEAVAVLSGGQGPGEYITEAEAMRRHLEAAGIDGERIRLEGNSVNTIQNLRFSKEILDAEFDGEPYRVLIVTNDFHIARSLFIARRLGIDAAGLPAGTPNIRFIKLSNYLREGFALISTAAQLAIK